MKLMILLLPLLWIPQTVCAEPHILQAGKRVHRLYIQGASKSFRESLNFEYALGHLADSLATSTGTDFFSSEPDSVEKVELVFKRWMNLPKGSHVVVSLLAHSGFENVRENNVTQNKSFAVLHPGPDAKVGTADDIKLYNDQLGQWIKDLNDQGVHVTYFQSRCYSKEFRPLYFVSDFPHAEKRIFIDDGGICVRDEENDNEYKFIFGKVAQARKHFKRLRKRSIKSRDLVQWMQDHPLFRERRESRNQKLKNHTEKTMKVTYIDLKRPGDSTLILTPSGRAIVIDGGLKVSYPRLKERLEHHGVEKIDLVIATHPDADHQGGLIELLKDARDNDTFTISEVWRSKVAEAASTELIQASPIGTRVYQVSHQRQIDTVPGLVVLSPPPELIRGETQKNTNSLLTSVLFKKVRFLFTADITRHTEKHLMGTQCENCLKTLIMNAPHHGSDTSSSPAFVKATEPQVVIFSSDGRSYGHPKPEIVQRYQDIAGAKTYRTDQLGHVSVETDGELCRVMVDGKDPEDCFRQPAGEPGTIAPPDDAIVVGSGKDVRFRTTLKHQDPAHSYRKAKDGPAELEVYTYTSRALVKNVRLRVGAYDVDEENNSPVNQHCRRAEIDKVSVNGRYVGTLKGRNQEFSITEFRLPASWIRWRTEESKRYGKNEIKIAIGQNAQPGCEWGARIHWVEIVAEQRPLIFVPGIMGTEIYFKEKRLLEMPWSPEYKIWGGLAIFTNGQGIYPLRLNQQGTAPYDKNWSTRRGQVLWKFHLAGGVGVDVYGEYLEQELSNIGYFSARNIEYARQQIGEEILKVTPLIEDNIRLVEFPYDWRMDNRNTATRLASVVDEVYRRTGSEKVFISAHSMGGLVSKYFINELGGDKKVQLLFTMGTPYNGAPKAYQAVAFANNLPFVEFAIDAIKVPQTLRNALKAAGRYYNRLTIASFPSAHQLMPSEYMWKAKHAPPINYRDFWGRLQSTAGPLDAYLEKWDTRVSPKDHARSAIEFHQVMAKPFPDDVDVYVAVGSGQETVVRVNAEPYGKKSDHREIKKDDGDGTVPLASAAGVNGERVIGRKFKAQHVPMPKNEKVLAALVDAIGKYGDGEEFPRPRFRLGEIRRLSDDEYNPCLGDPEMDPYPISAPRSAHFACLDQPVPNPPPTGENFDHRFEIELAPGEVFEKEFTAGRGTEVSTALENLQGPMEIRSYRQVLHKCEIYGWDINRQNRAGIEAALKENGEAWIQIVKRSHGTGLAYDLAWGRREQKYKVRLESKRNRESRATLYLRGRDRGDLGMGVDAGKSNATAMNIPLDEEFIGYLGKTDSMDYYRIPYLNAHERIRISLLDVRAPDTADDDHVKRWHNASAQMSSLFCDAQGNQRNYWAYGPFGSIGVYNRGSAYMDTITDTPGHFLIRLQHGYGAEHRYSLKVEKLKAIEVKKEGEVVGYLGEDDSGWYAKVLGQWEPKRGFATEKDAREFLLGRF